MKTPISLALAALLLCGPCYAGFDEGVSAYDAGNYGKALQELRPLASQGDARSQYAMGVMYEYGRGVEKNQSLAAQWYTKAARQGNTDAQYNLGVMYEQGYGVKKDFRLAANWYGKAAQAGDIDALSNLGVLYQHGSGVPQSRVVALALYNASVALDPQPDNKAVGNRKAVVNGITIREVEDAQELTVAIQRPGNLLTAISSYLKQHSRK